MVRGMSYRDDLDAAKTRRNVLARELRTVRHQLTDLETQANTLERELDKTARNCDQARARVSLPLLSQVRVASPCNERWDDMTGDDRVRHCDRCDKNVFDLSALGAEQAESLLREHGTSLCARFYRRKDGTVLTSDCSVGRRRKRFRNGFVAAVAGGLALLGIGVTVADNMVMGNLEEVREPMMGSIAEHPEEHVMMGKIAIAEKELSEPTPEDSASDEPADEQADTTCEASAGNHRP